MKIVESIKKLLETSTEILTSIANSKGKELARGLVTALMLSTAPQAQAMDIGNPLDIIKTGVGVAQTGVGLLNTGGKIQKNYDKIGNNRNGFSGDLNSINRVLRDVGSGQKQVERGSNGVGKILGMGGSIHPRDTNGNGEVSNSEAVRYNHKLAKQQKQQVSNNGYNPYLGQQMGY